VSQASPDGQFLVSGDENGVVRLWEVQTGRLLRSWDLNDVVVGSVGVLVLGKDDDKKGEMNG
jgi:WD40 repeat protein